MTSSPTSPYAADGFTPQDRDGDVLAEKLPGPRLVKLLKASVYKDCNIEPSMYLGAIAELLASTIFMSFLLTWMYDLMFGSDMLSNNPIHNMVGYNNPCAFWDQPPALYFAFLAFCPMVYLAIRYAHLDSLRADLTFSERKVGNAIINWTYAASQCIVMGIFVVTPMVAKSDWSHERPPTQEEVQKMHHHMRLHSAFFLQLVPCLCLAIVANYVEGYMSGVKLSNKQYFIVSYYIVTTILETICASYAIFGYQGRYLKDEPQYYQLPPWFMQMIDYAWFISLPMVTIVAPPAPNIIIKYSLEREEKQAQPCLPPSILGAGDDGVDTAEP